MNLTLQKWGNSAALRIPAPLLAQLGVRLGDAFAVEITPGVMTLRSIQPQQAPNDSALAALKFALQADDGMTFLHCWMAGDFDAIRKEWPNVPDTVFVGADPSLSETKKG